jgi:cytidylate kinase
MRDIIIAIDGYSSCGKSTLAKGLAKQLKYRYIDTGAMYRAVALYCMQNRLLSEFKYDKKGIIAALPNIKIDFQYNPDLDKTITMLNGVNVEEEIRDVPVSQLVTKVSQIPEVRKVLVKQQQEMGEQKAIVMDGRDIGTRVFPEAELKLFVTADPEVRARRRYKQMIDNGIRVNIEDVRKNLEQRDFDDVNKGDNPLKQAADAIVLDNTNIGVQEQFKKAFDLVLEVLGS